jgi:1,4-dihydroxy-2-naphthoate octaprenyltransferase
MVCCVFQATNLVNNYRPRKSARTFASRQEASNKLYTVLPAVFISFFSDAILLISNFRLRQFGSQNFEYGLLVQLSQTKNHS